MFLTNRLNPAGAETFLLHRVKHIDRTRYEPVVATLRGGGELAPAFERAGVRTVCFDMRRKLDPASLRRLHRFLREERIDILEAHVVLSCIVARIVGSLARTPVVITNVQDVRVGADPPPLYTRLLGDLTTPFTDAFVHITRAVERSWREGTPRLLANGKTVHRVIPNGIDARRIEDAARALDRPGKRREIGVPPGAFVIGNVARLHRSKGQRYLIDALPAVLRGRPDAWVVLVGWGKEEEALRAQAESLGVGDRVRLLGKRLDVHELLPAFDLFAFPSIHEAQGIALLEAMAAGVPIVAARSDGIPEIVRDGETGLLVPPYAAAPLGVAILRVAGDPALASRLVARAREVLHAEYTIERATELYQELYERLLSGRTAGSA
jgi:glycosyltransferase involved in cell wall biosynthesis